MINVWGRLATLVAILNGAKTRIYRPERNDEHRHAGKLCAAHLDENELHGVAFDLLPNGFRLQIEHPEKFYRKHAAFFYALQWDVPMSCLGGGNAVHQAFFTLEEYADALRISMSARHKLELSPAAVRAFVEGTKMGAPANDDAVRNAPRFTAAIS